MKMFQDKEVEKMKALATVQEKPDSEKLLAFQDAYNTHYNAVLYNRLGQYSYYTGNIQQAKEMFLMSKLEDGTFQLG